MENLLSLKDKVAIITGAGSGIGQAIALLFARQGSLIAVVDVDFASARESVELIEKEKGQAIPVKCDVSSPVEVKETVARILKHFHRVDILVNNAGIPGRKSAVETTEKEWDKVVDVDLKGYWHFAKEVLPVMMRKRSGKIVNIASIWGVVGFPHRAAYAAAKSGVIGLTRQMAVDYAPYKINVNSISPGVIETPFHTYTKSKKRTEYLKQIPLGRFGKPEDVANLALFLTSGESSYITGQNIVLDGGWTVE